jgi:hypothetical protein
MNRALTSPLSINRVKELPPSSPLNQNVMSGKEYDIVRKNTFLEVVPREGSRRRPHSEPAWSRETTPTRKPVDFLEDRSTDIGSSRGGSPLASPTLNTRGTLNNQPAMWQPATFFWQPYVVEGQNNNNNGNNNGNNNNMEWNNQPGFSMQEDEMYNGNNMQWMPWNGNNMQYNGYGEDGQFMMMDDHVIQHGPNGEPMQQWDGRDGNRHGMSWDERRANMDRDRMDRMDKRGMHMGQKRKPRGPNGKNGGGGKVFVGGLASKTTEETLLKVFSQYGNVVHASVLVDATSRRSRGFGYVTFASEVPEHVIDKDHLIDGRMCGARLYKYN